MTERTVTVQTETEETIEVCDECGLGDGVGELVTFYPKAHAVDDDLHIHLDCLDSMGVDVPDNLTYGELVDESTGLDIDHAVLAFDWEAIAYVAGGIVLFILTGLAAAADPVGASVFGICAILSTVFGMAYARTAATKTVEKTRHL